MVQADYYRQNAPSNSVAKARVRSHSAKKFISPTSTLRPTSHIQNTEGASPTAGASPSATPFYLSMD